MDFLINDKFLSHLAHEMVQQGSDYIGKNELLDFTIPPRCRSAFAAFGNISRHAIFRRTVSTLKE